MTSKAPPIPPEQRSFRGQRPDLEQPLDAQDRRDAEGRAKVHDRAHDARQNAHYQQDR